MFITVDTVYPAGTTLTTATGTYNSNLFYVRGARSILFAVRCTTDQTGTLAQNWGLGDDTASVSIQEVVASAGCVSHGHSGNIQPDATRDWFYFGLKSSDGNAIMAKWAKCRMVVTVANITNLEMKCIRVWDNEPTEAPETSHNHILTNTAAV